MANNVAIGGTVATAAPSARGTVSNANAVVGSFAAGFRGCYNEALGRNRDAAGTIRVIAKIGPDGAVESATSTAAMQLDQAMTDCCVHVVEKGRFAPPDSGGATLVIPVTFQVQPDP